MSPDSRWIGRNARLLVLVLCLCAAVAALLAGDTGIFSASAGEHEARVPAACVPAGVPALAAVGLEGVKRLRAAVLDAVGPLAPTRYAYGSVVPSDAWSDESPLRLAAAAQPGGLWSASFEMRVWVPDRRQRGRNDDVAADVFEFAGAAAAERFFAMASATECRRRARTALALRPLGARELDWLNPDEVAEADLYLLRGRRVYRVAVVPPESGGTGTPGEAAGAATEAIACELPAAGCTGPVGGAEDRRTLGAVGG